MKVLLFERQKIHFLMEHKEMSEVGFEPMCGTPCGDQNTQNRKQTHLSLEFVRNGITTDKHIY